MVGNASKQLKILLGISQMRYTHYSDLAKSIADPETKQLLLKLASETKMFFTELKGVLLTVSDLQQDIILITDLYQQPDTNCNIKINLFNCNNVDKVAIKSYEDMLLEINHSQIHFKIVSRQLRAIKEAKSQLFLVTQPLLTSIS